MTIKHDKVLPAHLLKIHETRPRRLAVVRGGEDCGPSAVARRLPSPDRWAAAVDLRDEKVRLGELAAAVHTCAPGLPVWGAGKVKAKAEVT
jgi:hypothetical protein